jgi:hypothetical protein
MGRGGEQLTRPVSCTGTSIHSDVKGYGVSMPTIGNNTHRDNCALGRG